MEPILFAALVVLLLLFMMWLALSKPHEGMSSDIYQAGSLGITASSAIKAYERSNVLGGKYPSLSNYA